MWRLRVEYGKNAWLEARPGSVTLSTRFDTLLYPYAIVRSIARILYEEARKAPEGKRGDHVAGVVGGRGFERRLERMIRSHRVTLEEPFRVDLGWFRLEVGEERLDFEIDREAAEDALAPLGAAEWPRGVPWPAYAPKTRVGDVRAFIHLYCDTPWLRDMVEARALIGMGPAGEEYARRIEELVECHEELASWGLLLRKPKSTELCAPKPVVFAVFPLLHYARNMPYNMLLFLEDPALHANTELLDAVTGLLASMVEKGAALVLHGDGAERVYRDIKARGVQAILA